MELLIQFFLLYHTFGPAIAIPFGITNLSLWQMFSFVVLSQSVLLIFLYFFLELFEYEKQHNAFLVSRFEKLTKKEKNWLGKKSSKMISLFSSKFGHLGYYLAIFFISFSLGLAVAFASSLLLRLRRITAFFAILLGNLLSFSVWYYIMKHSLSFVDASLILYFGVIVSLVFLAYGRIREANVFQKIHDLHLTKKAKKLVH